MGVEKWKRVQKRRRKKEIDAPLAAVGRRLGAAIDLESNLGPREDRGGSFWVMKLWSICR